MNRLRQLLKHPGFTAAIAALSLLATPSAHANTNYGEALQLFNDGKFEEARQVFEAIAKASPRDAQARSCLGQIELKASRYDKAAKWFEQAVSLSQTNIDHLLWLARAYGRLAAKQGAPFGAGPARKCKATLERVLALAPDELRARHGLIEFHMEAPGIVGGNVKEAYRQAEEIRKRDACEGLVALADLYLRDQKFEDATKALESAIKEKPSDLKPRYRLARVHAAAKHYDEAFAIYEGILATQAEGRQTAYFLIGETAARSGQQLERGEAALKSYLQWQPVPRTPSRTVAWLRLGNLYEKKRRPDQAKAAYEEALKLDSQNKEAADARRRLSK